MSAALEPAIVDPASSEYWEDPYGVLAAARRQGRTARTPQGELALLGYADGHEALRHPKLQTFGVQALLERVGVTEGPFHDWSKLLLLSMNPPDHTRLRGLVRKAFSPRQIERVRPATRDKLRHLLAESRDRGQVEWVSAIAHELPVWVICELVGAPPEDRDTFKQWTVDIGHAFSQRLSAEQLDRANNAVTSLYGYLRELVDKRRRAPQDDLLSALVHAEEDGDRLSTDELHAIVANLLVGGHNTTRTLLSICALLLAQHPDQFRRVADDPGLVGNTVEEVLRFEAPIPSSMRQALEDVELAGAQVRAGEAVFVSFLSANHDPDHFDRPELFDVARKDIRPISFGHGIHHCVGSPLARLEAQEAVAELTSSFRSIELEIDRPRWEPFVQVRRIEELPLRLHPR